MKTTLNFVYNVLLPERDDENRISKRKQKQDDVPFSRAFFSFLFSFSSLLFSTLDKTHSKGDERIRSTLSPCTRTLLAIFLHFLEVQQIKISWTCFSSNITCLIVNREQVVQHLVIDKNKQLWQQFLKLEIGLILLRWTRMRVAVFH